MESHDTARESSSQMLDTVRQVLALMITSYPVVVPLLEELERKLQGRTGENRRVPPQNTADPGGTPDGL